MSMIDVYIVFDVGLQKIYMKRQNLRMNMRIISMLKYGVNSNKSSKNIQKVIGWNCN